MGFDPLRERFAGEADNAQRRIQEGGPTRSAIDGQPDLGRELSADSMEAEGREQTDHALRHGGCRHGQAMVFGHRRGRQAILPAGDALQFALAHQPAQDLAMDAGRNDIARGQTAPAAGKLEEPFTVGGIRHVAKCSQLSISVNSSTHDVWTCAQPPTV